MEDIMAKRLSEQLADLAVRAKSAEDAFDGAQKEAHDKLEARKHEARAAAENAIARVDQEIRAGAAPMAKDLSAVKAKVAADMNALKANVATAKHKLDVKMADKRADELEWEAGFAVDYAIASVEQAKLAVLDAVDGRLAAEQAKRA
jgi:hypothetical protein